MNQITVLIADDHAVLREGLHKLLEQEADIKVVGEAMDGLQALTLTESLQPDILLLDIKMPEVDGLKALPDILAKSPKTKVLILSGYSEDDYVAEALQCGARGFLQKTITYADLVRAIRATYHGELWVGHKAVTQLLDSMLQRVQAFHGPVSGASDELTDREREVVNLVVQGMTNKEIGTQLGISEKTVKTHLANIFTKLKISRRLELFLHTVDHTN